MKNVNKLVVLGFAALGFTTGSVMAQHVKRAEVPAVVKSALLKQYPSATEVGWEKEKGNYEASWGGKSKEDNSVVFTPEGVFVEKVVAILISSLPPEVSVYVLRHYAGAKITEAGKVTDAQGVTTYEAEVKGKDLIFDEKGKFVKID